MEHKSPQGDCREEHKEEGEDNTQSLLMGVVPIKENLSMDPSTIKENLLMGAHNSMLVTWRSNLKMFLQYKIPIA